MCSLANDCATEHDACVDDAPCAAVLACANECFMMGSGVPECLGMCPCVAGPALSNLVDCLANDCVDSPCTALPCM
jgi:hypothetical protein